MSTGAMPHFVFFFLDASQRLFLHVVQYESPGWRMRPHPSAHGRSVAPIAITLGCFGFTAQAQAQSDRTEAATQRRPRLLYATAQ